MANKALRAFNKHPEIEFWLDGVKAPQFVSHILSYRVRVLTAVKKGIFLKLAIFYIKCALRLSVDKKEAEVSSLVYHHLIVRFLDIKRDDHVFRLVDTGKNIRMETNFKEKDAFLSIFRILDEYAKVVLINQYNLTQEKVHDKVVIDGGANMGEFSILCARLGAKKVYAFEPVTSTFNMLKHQVALNGLEEKIILVNKALGNVNEKVTMTFLEPGDSGAHIANTTSDGQSQVIDAVKLDDEIGEEQVGFIKLDVEGYEEEALTGARAIVERDKPTLTFSAYHKPTDIERLPALIHSIRPDYTITLLHKAEPDFFCE